MTLMIIGLVLFLGVHSTSIVAGSWRDAMVERLGEGPWKGLYSVASLLGFGLLVYGYGVARAAPQVLWVPPTGLRHFALLLLLPVFVLLAAVYLPGRIKNAAKHPMLLATKLWATAHLLGNRVLTVADAVLFGAFLAWAVADRISLKKRGKTPEPAPPSTVNDAVAVAVGLGLYVAFVLWIHRWLIGVSPV